MNGQSIIEYYRKNGLTPFFTLVAKNAITSLDSPVVITSGNSSIILDIQAFNELSLSNKSFRKDKRYGWSKNCLALSLSLSAGTAVATTATQATVSASLINKLFISVVAILVANAANPSIKHFITRRTVRRSYLVFLAANVESTLSRFGQAASFDFIKQNIIESDPPWLQILEDADSGIPELLIIMRIAFERSASYEAFSEGYIPYVSYTGMATTIHDHEYTPFRYTNSKVGVCHERLTA